MNGEVGADDTDDHLRSTIQSRDSHYICRRNKGEIIRRNHDENRRPRFANHSYRGAVSVRDRSSTVIVYFYSLTGNVRRFIAKTGLGGQAREVKTGEVVEEPFVLVTPTYDFGQPPATVSEWLKDNGDWMVGVAASGNRAWGDGFGAAADVIATLYDVPVIGKFELAGTEEDVQLFTERVKAL